MKRVAALAFSATLIISLACGALAQPIKLAYKYTKGEVDKARMTMKMTMLSPGMGKTTSMHMSISSVYTQQTLAVFRDGSARVKVTISDLKVTMPGMTEAQRKAAQRPPISYTAINAPDGTVTKVEGMGKALAASGMTVDPSQVFNVGGQSGAKLPDKPVNVGAAWNDTLPLPYAKSKINVASTLVATGVPVYSMSAAKIKQDLSGSMDLAELMKAMMGTKSGQKGRASMSSVKGTLDMAGSMTYLFSPALGKVLMADGKIRCITHMSLPTDAAKQAGRSSFDTTQDMDISLRRFK